MAQHYGTTEKKRDREQQQRQKRQRKLERKQSWKKACCRNEAIMRKCRWKCGGETPNLSGICDQCWQAAAPLRSNRHERYGAWLEHRKAKQLERKPLTERQQAALTKARAAKFTGHFRFTDVSSGNAGIQ